MLCSVVHKWLCLKCTEKNQTAQCTIHKLMTRHVNRTQTDAQLPRHVHTYTPNRFQNPKIQCILLHTNLRTVAVLCGIMILVLCEITIPAAAK